MSLVLNTSMMTPIKESTDQFRLTSMVTPDIYNESLEMMQIQYNYKCECNRINEEYYKAIVESAGNEELIQEAEQSRWDKFKAAIAAFFKKIIDAIKNLLHIDAENSADLKQKAEKVKKDFKDVKEDIKKAKEEKPEVVKLTGTFEFDDIIRIAPKAAKIMETCNIDAAKVLQYIDTIFKMIEDKSNDYWNENDWKAVCEEIGIRDKEQFKFEEFVSGPSDLVKLFSDKNNESEGHAGGRLKEEKKIKLSYNFDTDEVDGVGELSQIMDEYIEHHKQATAKFKSIKEQYEKFSNEFNAKMGRLWKDDDEQSLIPQTARSAIMQIANYFGQVSTSHFREMRNAVIDAETDTIEIFEDFVNVLNKKMTPETKTSESVHIIIDDDMSHKIFVDGHEPDEDDCCCGECDEEPIEVAEVPDDEDDDDYEDHYEEIPVSAEDVSDALQDVADDLEESVKESMNLIIEHKDYSALTRLYSDKDPEFGKNLLKKIYENRTNKLSMDDLQLEETIIDANIATFQSIFTGDESNAKFAKLIDLSVACESYLGCIKARKEHLDKINSVFTEAVDYLLEAELGYIDLLSKIEDREYKHFIKECLTITQHKPSAAVMKELAILNEEAEDQEDAWYDKILQFFKDLWAKFIERIDYFFRANEKYLTKNKDTILQKKPTIKVQMYDYLGSKANMDKIKIDDFESLYKSNPSTLESEEALQKELLGGEYDASRQFPEMCLAAFRGKEEKEYTAEQLGSMMNDIYEFCAKYVDRRNALKNDKEAIEKAHAFFKNERKKLKQEKNTQQAAQPPKTEDDKSKEGDEPTITKKDDDKPQESAVYTEAFGFVHEFEVNKPEGEAKPEGGSSDGGEKTNDVKDLKAKFKIYNSVVKSIYSAKLKCTEEAYGNFMKVIKAHIDSFKTEAPKEEPKADEEKK